MTVRPEDLAIAPEAKARDSLIEFWFLCWLGIALSGGAFGFAVGLVVTFGEADATLLFIGPVAGTILAGIWAVPIVATLAVLTWVAGLSRFRRTSPSLAGACTGLLSTGVPLSSELDAEWLYLVILAAGAFGAVGGYVSGAMYRKSRGLAEYEATNRRWQFSLRDLFLRFTAASILIACWVLALQWLFADKLGR